MSYRVLFQFDLFMQPSIFDFKHGTAYRRRTHLHGKPYVRGSSSHKNDKFISNEKKATKQLTTRELLFTIMIQYEVEKDKSWLVLLYFILFFLT